LVPGKESKLDNENEKIIKKEDKKTKEKPTPKKNEEKKPSDDKKEFEEIEKNVLETIKNIEGEDGASWDKITEECKKNKLDKDSVEEALSSLMDKGLIYEPILGTIKTT
jgi:DNA replicative helicase MCM subunit Mcm2 (Cdc46/Mcm family)